MNAIEIQSIKIPFIGEQLTSHVFKVNSNYYHGRVEEARKKYSMYPDIWGKYSFIDYVHMTYVEYKKPRNVVKQEIINLCADSLTPSEITKLLCLINKL